jgi:hypothetical protein
MVTVEEEAKRGSQVGDTIEMFDTVVYYSG